MLISSSRRALQLFCEFDFIHLDTLSQKFSVFSHLAIELNS